MKWQIDTGMTDNYNLPPAGAPRLPLLKIIDADKYTFEKMTVGDEALGKYTTVYVHFWRGDQMVGTFPSFKSIMLIENEAPVAEAA